MNLFPWLAGCWFAAAVCAAIVQTYVAGWRSWEAPEVAVTFADARPVLDGLPAQDAGPGQPPEFRLRANRAHWYALDLPPLPQASVLELTHPAIRTAELFLPGQGSHPVARGGREWPAEARVHDRFPATLAVPRSTEPRRAYLRVVAPVAARGTFVLQPRHPWEMQSRLLLAGMTLGFGATLLAAVFAAGRASGRRSAAYLLYALFACASVLAGMFVTGLGEATVWSPVARWRAPVAAVLGGLAAGLALLLAQRMFLLERSAPGFSRVLLALGIACPLLGLAALGFAPAVQRGAAHAAGSVAALLSLASLWFAARTRNGPVAWLAIGHLFLVAGAAVVALAHGGAFPFQPWVLAVLPAASAAAMPWHLHALRRFEERRALVLYRRARLDAIAGHMDETRDEVAARLALPRTDLPPKNPGATLLLLRFAGLGEGSATARSHDSLELEAFFEHMMAAGLRPGIEVGRWSYNEVLLRDLDHANDARLRGLIASLFEEARRCRRFGLEPHEPRLRIAWMRVKASRVPVILLARQLARALDDPGRRHEACLALDTWEDD